MSFMIYLRCFNGIVLREALRFVHQKERFFSALVRPLVWLGIFAAGFRSVLGVSIIPPYETYIPYEVYIAPGLIAMIQLFNGMQSSLSMVYDREMGSMKTMLVSPIPRWFLLVSKLLAGVFVSILQVYAFLIIASLWDIIPPVSGYITILPALIISGLMLGSLGMFLSSAIKQLENFAGVMNFVIFPMFFASSALYPLWKIEETSEWLYYVCFYNPFTYAVESIRFSLYSQINIEYSIGIIIFTLIFLFLSILGYDPGRGNLQKKGVNEFYKGNLLFLILFVSTYSLGKGDLAIRAKKLELKLGSEKSDYEMSQKIFEMETGKAYRLEISSMGFKEYEIEAEDFFRNIWVRGIEVEGIEIDTPVINEIELEREGEIEIKFVPIRPGDYEFEIEGLQSKGMKGVFKVR